MPIKRKSISSPVAEQLKKLKARQSDIDKQYKKQQAAHLKAFRSQVAALKRKGIVGKNIDARSANPTKALKATIRTFSDVIDRTARVFKIGGKKAKQYAAMGYRVKRGRVALPKADGGYVPTRGRDAGLIKETRQVGEGPKVTKTVLPVTASSLDEFLETLQSKPPLKDGESYGIRFFGWNLGRSFSDIEDLIEFLERYESVEKAKSASDQTEVIQNIEIVKIGSKQQLAWNKQFNKQRALVKQAKRDTYNKSRKYKKRELNDFAKAKKREYDRAYAARTYDTFANTMKRRKQRKSTRTNKKRSDK